MISVVLSSVEIQIAFFRAEVPQNLRMPLQVRAPEAIFNHLSALLRVEFGTQVDVWSVGCLVRPQEINTQRETNPTERSMSLLRQVL